MRVASAIELDEAQREKLVKLAHSNTTEVRLARRVSIVLLAADGLDNRKIAELVGVGRIQVGRWRERYAAGGLKAIEQDLLRGGRKNALLPPGIRFAPKLNVTFTSLSSPVPLVISSTPTTTSTVLLAGVTNASRLLLSVRPGMVFVTAIPLATKSLIGP